MPVRTPFRPPLFILGLVMVAAGTIHVTSKGSRGPAGFDPLPPECAGLSEEACRARPGSTGLDPSSPNLEPVLSMAEVCLDVGYLCADADSSGSLRLLRWPEDQPVIRVLVPEPDGISRASPGNSNEPPSGEFNPGTAIPSLCRSVPDPPERSLM